MNVWNREALARTADLFLGVGSDDGLPDPVRFVRGVARIVDLRTKRSADQEPGRFAYFLLHPPEQARTLAGGITWVPMLDFAKHRISGRLWFVNKVASEGVALEIDAEAGHDVVVERVRDSLSLGDVPALVVEMDGDEPEVRFFPDGLSNLQEVRRISLSSDVTLETILEALDAVYRNSLVTPEAQNRASKLWAKPDRYCVADDAEDEIQSVVKAALAGRFFRCDIRHEQPSPEGRFDLSIEETPTQGDASLVLHHALIELKVLRSRRSSESSVSDNYNAEWVRKGVIQAEEYGRGRNARLYLLFCFDMRFKDATSACIDSVAELALALNVVVKSWQLFPSSEEYREVQAASRLA